ncbi:hypothetical protein FGB62_79g036 [Gracilaria domingensis]|nr:hypothetical protein FGB62_79g036 [Gracilaria domingensis]
MKRSRVAASDDAPSLATVQPLDLEQLADDLELSEQVRHSVQQIVDEWDDAPSSLESSPSAPSIASHPMKLWASIRRLWNAVLPAEQQQQHPPALQPPRPTPATKRSLLSSRPTTSARHPRPHAASSASSRGRRFFTAAEKQKAVLKPSLRTNLPADSAVDPFFTPHNQQKSAAPEARSASTSIQAPPPSLRSSRRLPPPRGAQRALSRRGVRQSTPAPVRRAIRDDRAMSGIRPPSSPFSHVTRSNTPLSTPPKSPTLSNQSDTSPRKQAYSTRQALSKSSSFASTVTSSSEQNMSMHSATSSPKSPPLQPVCQAPPYQLHEQLSQLSLVDPPPSQTPLEDFFDVDIDDSAVANNTFPTDDDISTLRLLRNRSQSTPGTRRPRPQSPTTPERQPSLRRLHSTRTVMRVAKSAVQDVERLASLRRRITGDMRVDRRLAHLRLLQSQLRARRARLPSAEDAKERLTGALDKLREKKRQALIEQQRRLSSSWRVPKLGDVPRNVKLPPLRRSSRRTKEQRMTSSPTDIRRTSYAS